MLSRLLSGLLTCFCLVFAMTLAQAQQVQLMEYPVAGRWDTSHQPGRLQALLRLAKRPISDHGAGRDGDGIYRDQFIRRADLLLCCQSLH